MTLTRYALLLFLLPVLVFACGKRLETVEAKDEYGYTERYARRTTDYARQGEYRRFDPAGQLVEEARYENDTLNGLRILYYEDGDTQTVETYVHGQFDGPWRTYYESGTLQLEGRYVNNEMTGEWRRYYESGQLEEVVTFENNQENGPFVEYYPNGNRKADGAYRDGDYEHGLLREYNEQGELVRKAQCENGICRTIWRADSEPTDNG